MPKDSGPIFFIIDYGAEKMPQRMYDTDAGMDIYAPETFHVPAGEHVLVALGFGVQIPDGFAAFVKPRGSIGLSGLIPVDNPIDSDYRGEVHADMWNVSKDTVVIRKGERFCQLVCVPIVTGEWPIINPADAEPTERGQGSHGSTGV